MWGRQTRATGNPSTVLAHECAGVEREVIGTSTRYLQPIFQGFQCDRH
ncbi:MAG: hypothetical protein V7L31_22585 [Nostoc sp.]